jgi:hypothetical protein
MQKPALIEREGSNQDAFGIAQPAIIGYSGGILLYFFHDLQPENALPPQLQTTHLVTIMKTG